MRNPEGICFVGAMNHDIVSRSRMPSDVRKLLLSRHNANNVDFSETAISDEDSERILDRLNDVQYRSELGGSGFNAIRSATLLGSNIRLGFVGVVGHINNAYPHIDFLYSNNVEIPFLRQEHSPCARSISFSFDGDRTLLTALGANAKAAEFFNSLNSLISNYLISFSTIHVTSFLDSRTIDSLGNILCNTLSISSKTRISIDPGAIWVNNLSHSVERIIATASVLHLNEREFGNLGGRLRDEDDLRVAERIAKMMRAGKKSIILRRHRSITVHTFSELGTSSVSIDNPFILSDGDVVDATGAGDTLTGLLLAILESDAIVTSLAAALAMNITVEKLRHAGAVNPIDFQVGLSKKVGPIQLSNHSRNFRFGDASNA